MSPLSRTSGSEQRFASCLFLSGENDSGPSPLTRPEAFVQPLIGAFLIANV